MALVKKGSQVKITKRAFSATEALVDKPQDLQISDIIHKVDPEFLFYTAKAISSLEPTLCFNGNGDGFPKSELKKAYKSFENRGIYLNHDSDSLLKSVGTILSAEYLEDPETGSAEIQILGRIDRKLHPEIARMIETGELNSTSMGCSCDESICSVCGTTLHSDADEKCEHLSPFGLNKKYIAEVDMPEYGIHKGAEVIAGSINKGITFNEDSLVNVPADPTAKVSQILARNMRSRLSKKAALTKEEQLDLLAQLDTVMGQFDNKTQNELKAEFCGCPTPVKESSMSDKNANINDDTKQALSKISAYEMDQLEKYIMFKNKKANEVADREIVAEASKKEETFLQKVMDKVKNSFAAQMLEKKVEAVAKAELGKEAEDLPEGQNRFRTIDPHNRFCATCKTKLDPSNPSGYCLGCGKKALGSFSAKFTEDKTNILASTWGLYKGDKLILDATLNDIWGAQFQTLPFKHQTFATSEAYGKQIIARYEKQGLEKLADLWDVTNKISKVAEGPDLGPSGTFAKPSTGSSNKEHSVKNSPIEKPGQEQGQKGPAAPAHADVKTETKLDMPGQEAGQKGPAAPKAKEVKTDYSEPKPEAEGKEVKTTPKNPDEKDAEKSKKEVKTDYVAASTEAMEAEEKGSKKEAKSRQALNKLQDEGKCTECEQPKLKTQKDQIKCNKCLNEKKSAKEQNAMIKWSTLSGEAQDFIKKHVEKHIKEDGMERDQAVAAAYSEAREKGMDVPKKSNQEPNMNKKAADKPVESVEGSTLPEGTKKFDAKPDEAVEGTTLPGGAAPTSAPETSAQGDKEHKTPNLTKKPDEAVDGTTLPPQGKKDEESVEKSTHPDSKKTVGTEPEKAVQASSKKAATEMPMPETSEEVKIDEKPAGTPEADPMAPVTDGPKPEDKGAVVSAFDKVDGKLDIGEGYEAHKDEASKEIVIMKDGKEVKRLPDGFGADVPTVLKLMKAVLGLAPTEEPAAGKPEIVAPKPMDEAKPDMAEKPMDESHEDPLAMKESALKVKEAELKAKEASLNAIEAKAKEDEKAKKFASLIQARSERCKKLVEAMIEKEALSYDNDIYEAELMNELPLLEARQKAYEFSISAKMKTLLAMDDKALAALESAVGEIKAPVSGNTKKASWLSFSPSYDIQLTEDQELAKIFNTMGDPKKRPQ